LARRLGAAPSRLSFGDSVAQAGARRKEIGVVGRMRHGGRAQAPVKSQPRKKRAGKLRQPLAVRKDLPAHAISIKNKHLLVIFSDPNPRFHGGCFGV